MREPPEPSLPTPAKPRRQWSAATRATLLDAGIAAFAQHGFDGVTEDAIARTVGLTRGALQYQFGDKRGLFAEVFRRALADLGSKLSDQTMEISHSVHELGAGIDLFMGLASDERWRRLLLTDGPAVLGWDAWRVELRTAFAPLLHHALGHWAEAGLIAPEEVAGHAELILGAAVHAALADAAADPGPRAALDAILRRLSTAR